MRKINATPNIDQMLVGTGEVQCHSDVVTQGRVWIIYPQGEKLTDKLVGVDTNLMSQRREVGQIADDQADRTWMPTVYNISNSGPRVMRHDPISSVCDDIVRIGIEWVGIFYEISSVTDIQALR